MIPHAEVLKTLKNEVRHYLGICADNCIPQRWSAGCRASNCGVLQCVIGSILCASGKAKVAGQPCKSRPYAVWELAP